MIRGQTNTKKSEQKFEINMSQNFLNTGCLIWISYILRFLEILFIT